jgi:hypothetical protein
MALSSQKPVHLAQGSLPVAASSNQYIQHESLLPDGPPKPVLAPPI